LYFTTYHDRLVVYHSIFGTSVFSTHDKVPIITLACLPWWWS